jgi:hypothetical protein
MWPSFEMHNVNNFYIHPSVSQIAKGYNPMKDTLKNYPVQYIEGVVGGTGAQMLAGNALPKSMGLAATADDAFSKNNGLTSAGTPTAKMTGGH